MRIDVLTTDRIYYKPLLPQIFINNTANNAVQYQYSSFTGTAAGTGLTNVFPFYCNVNLSKNTHGEFTVQFEDSSKVMENVVTVGSRVIIKCGKQSTATTSLISGLLERKAIAEVLIIRFFILSLAPRLASA